MSSIPYSQIEPHVPSAVGTQVRVNHDACHDRRARLYIKRTPNSVLSYCHNCGGHNVRPYNRVRTKQQLIDDLLGNAAYESMTRKEAVLPDDVVPFPNLWPAEAASWLYQYELDDKDIQDYSITYSPAWGRVILPVYKDGKLVFWQGRSIDGSDPKYISVKSAAKPLFTAIGGSKELVVITEDVLSAIKVAKTGMADAIALLGTHEPDNIATLIEHYKRVVVWLDRDDAGRKAESDVVQRLKLIAKPEIHTVQIAHGKLCPKETTLERLTTFAKNVIT